MIDAIDKAAGLSPDEALFNARRLRPEFVQGAEQCRVSVLQPANDQQLAKDLRLALACRMARLNHDEALIADYQAQLVELHPTESLIALAAGETTLHQPLAAIARQVDLVTLTPAKAEADDMKKLAQAGLTNPQIVALSELIAFVNFQTRVAAGLRLMRSA
ncbi:CMD domain-containing protein [Kalamiella sp. sgz302252]|uniref:CMD domain-containing protein n=1 Tax=Pantoea sp. sgz302252 TaxID=3341827 RepID=UPI0036D375D1